MPRLKGKRMSSLMLNRKYKPRTCKRCGMLMVVLSGHTEYCNRCKPIVEREKKKRERIKRMCPGTAVS